MSTDGGKFKQGERDCKSGTVNVLQVNRWAEGAASAVGNKELREVEGQDM